MVSCRHVFLPSKHYPVYSLNVASMWLKLGRLYMGLENKAAGEKALKKVQWGFRSALPVPLCPGRPVALGAGVTRPRLPLAWHSGSFQQVEVGMRGTLSLPRPVWMGVHTAGVLRRALLCSAFPQD